ncbi:hypothetical protein GCM10023116_18800 [Kistimonas scapharcae]|uniref:Uncharacterized protein n=1 Tax=Kistimonas scapharcae TaxID=1036133 RepID=A0ABP8V1G1_9GAMM
MLSINDKKVLCDCPNKQLFSSRQMPIVVRMGVRASDPLVVWGNELSGKYSKTGT